MTLTNGSSFGSYEVIGRLGAGGMGEVYRARDTRLPREVAIKVSGERFSDRFAREVQIIASLNHPNISTLYDVGPDYLVMELVEGPTLAERLADGPLSFDQAVGIARQIADALDYAHERAVVHRDLKPANIKIRPDGVVKVLDFGLAKSGLKAAPASDLTPTISARNTEVGTILGTAAYMSPEQAKGKEVDKRADIWAFGCVFYEMLTGSPPHQGDSSQETMASILRDEPDLRKVPAQARRLLRRCLEKDPQKRLRHIGDVMALLDEPPSGESSPATATPLDLRTRSSRRWLLPTAAIAGVLLVGAAVIWWAPWSSPEPLPDAVQFEVGPAEKMTFITGGGMAVSPDGRWMVFPAVGEDGATRFWIRSLDSVEVRALPGTEVGPITPPAGWTHDSRYVLFSQNNTLKRVDISGGPPQSLADLPAAHNGVASNGEVILLGLAPNVRGALLGVPARGGTATPVTQLDPGDRRHAFPQFLPDGRHFLYLRVAADANRMGVYVGSIDAKPGEQSSDRLLATDREAYYAKSPRGGGHLVFMRERTLLAQPFDVSTQKLTGEAVPIADGVDSFSNANFGLFSVSDNGTLVYRSGPSAAMTLTWLDASGRPAGTLGEAGEYTSPAVSPDGSRLAVARGRAGARDIHIVDVARGASSQFTFSADDEDAPVWSPDGKNLVFASRRNGQPRTFVRPADGSREERMLVDDAEPSSWSTDGRFLLITRSADKTGTDVWVVPDPAGAAGPGKPVPVIVENAVQGLARFSPEGRWVAYTSLEAGLPQIYVRAFSYVDGAVVTGPKRLVSKGAGFAPRWSAAGDRLFYGTGTLQMFAVDIDTRAGFQAGEPRHLFNAPPPLLNTWWDFDTRRERFLFVAAPASGRTSPFTVVLNWESRLRK
jgi:hypothetical protein